MQNEKVENINNTHLAFDFEGTYIFLPVYIITKKQLLENSECFNILIKGMQSYMNENQEDTFNEFLFDIQGYLYAELEKKHYKSPEYVSMLFNRFENFLEVLFLQGKLVNPKNSLEVISLKEYENQLGDITNLKTNLLFFFLTYLLYSKTQKVTLNPSQKNLKLSDGLYLTLLPLLEFQNYIHSI